MAQPQVPFPLSFSGRNFTADELQLIQALAADFSALSLTGLSRTVCELLQWKRPNGGLKNHGCRLLLERLTETGCIRLPALRPAGPRGPRLVAVSDQGEPESELSGSAHEFEPLQLQVIQRGLDESSRLWMELVERYHYLGYRAPVGANLRYLVRSARCPGQVLACLLWTSPAWRMAVRDRWVGWSDSERLAQCRHLLDPGLPAVPQNQSARIPDRRPRPAAEDQNHGYPRPPAC